MIVYQARARGRREELAARTTQTSASVRLATNLAGRGRVACVRECSRRRATWCEILPCGVQRPDLDADSWNSEFGGSGRRRATRGCADRSPVGSRSATACTRGRDR